MKTRSRTRIVSQIVEAVGRYLEADGCLWKIADLLVKLCGSPGPNGAHNDSAAKLKKVAAALKGGFGEKAARFGRANLERLRSVAAKFPPHTRVGGVAFNVHWAAGDPQTLQLAKKEAERRKVALTVEFVKEFKARRGEMQKPEWVTAIHELRGITADAAEHAEDLKEFLQQSRKELTPADIKSLRSDIAEVRALLSSASNTVNAIDRLLQPMEAAA